MHVQHLLKRAGRGKSSLKVNMIRMTAQLPLLKGRSNKHDPIN